MIAGAAALVALPVVAFQHEFKLTPGNGVRDGLQNRAAVQTVPTVKRSVAKAPSAQARVKAYYGDNIDGVLEYGELELILEEDFSKITTGSEENPDKSTVLEYTVNDKEYTYPWANFRTEFTHQPEWGVGKAYAAGGMLMFEGDEESMNQAHVNLPRLDCRGEGGGLCVVEFKAKAEAGTEFPTLLVEATDTHGWAPSWDSLEGNGQTVFQKLPDQWTTYRVLYYGGAETTLFNIVSVGAGKLFIDDVKAYKVKPHVYMTEAKKYTNYKGTSFTARWQEVKDADYYLLDVYDVEANGEIRDYVVKDQKVEGTEFDVTGVVSAHDYFYTVRTVKGDKVSLACTPYEVFTCESPVLEAEPVGDFGYHAHWNAVEGADVYDYWAWRKRVADRDGEFVVTDEHFTGVATAEGDLTGWDRGEIDAGYYDKYYPKELHQRGWYGLHYSPFTDFISIAGFFYFYNDWDNAGFISPELDLSKDGGKINISMRLAGEATELQDENGKIYEYAETACVALFNWNEDKQDYDQVELVYVNDPDDPQKQVSTDWRDFNVTLTKGSERSIIGIYAVGGPGDLYIDDLKITQNYKKGEYLLDPFLMVNYHGRPIQDPNDFENWIEVDGTKIDVDIPGYATGTEVFHNAQSVRRRVYSVGMGQEAYDETKSAFSDLKFVRSTESGVENVVLSKAEITVANGVVRVDNPENREVVVYSIDGRRLKSSNSKEVVYELSEHGAYVVAVGGEALKFVW